MTRKFSLILTLTAWLIATGSHWDMVQTLAWARMFTANVRVLPWPAAVARTFAPEGRCQLCFAVAKAKEQQQQGEGAGAVGKVISKIQLVFPPSADVCVEAPVFAPWPVGIESVVSAGRAAPLVPPPRAALA